MRDDFTVSTKDQLAKRVGFLCSNPGCQQPTVGPRSKDTGSVNLGVAAHITAASPRGPRYDSSLTAEERSSHSNGIWLCQTCAKLIDSDVDHYTREQLLSWRTAAEEDARRRLETRLKRFPSRAETYTRIERLMPDLLAEMRRDIASHPLGRELIALRRGNVYWPGEKTILLYYYDDHKDLLDKFRILENEGLIRDIAFNDLPRYVFTEDFAEYLGAP